MTVEINREVFYTPAEFAALMRYADARPVLRYIKSGDIPAVARMDGRKLIPAKYVNAILSKAGSNNGHR